MNLLFLIDFHFKYFIVIFIMRFLSNYHNLKKVIANIFFKHLFQLKFIEVKVFLIKKIMLIVIVVKESFIKLH